MADCYLIRNWNEHFECAQSRKVGKPLNWVATPCKHDGKSFRRLMLMNDGVEIYGAWILMVQVAAKCPTRGILADGDGPLTVEDLSIKTGCPTAVFDKAIKVLSSQQIGWVLVAQWESNGISLPPPTNQQNQQTIPTNQPPLPQEAAPNATAAVPEAGRLVGGRTFELTWDAVGKRLAALNVVQWKQALLDAQASGSDPQRCHWLIDHAEKYGYGPGAISKRFKVASPQLGINSGWPNTDRPETTAEKRAQSESGKRAQHAAESAESQANAIIKRSRRAGKTRDQILLELSAEHLTCPEWYQNPAQPLTVDEKRRIAEAVQ